MGRIRTLPAHVVNQIAAGEVVERPASVVKELVENSIDAGATRVDVRLEDGGRGRIEIADDGIGMDAVDLAAAFLPHATSKLSSVEDLEHIGSLGFRGEALASIGSVSRARIVSRPRGASTGAGVDDVDGTVSEVRPAAAAPGTVIVVEGLFASVPARRKFLRSAQTELGHVTDVVVRFALAHPDVVFTLTHGGRTLVETTAGEGRRARLARFHGADVARALVEVEPDPDAAIAVTGFVSPPGVSRGDTRLQQTFLNGRHLRDKTVTHALREAYRDLVPPGDRHPIVFLFLTCDPAGVDVNVHPTKAEVRWREPSAVHEAVRRGVRRALEAARPGVDMDLSARSVPTSTVEAARFAFESGAGRSPFATALGERPAPASGGGAAGARANGSEADALPPHAPTRGTGVHEHDAHAACSSAGHAHAADHGGAGGATREHLRPLGQALGTYLVFESDDGLVLVDQHALHERVLFDRISSRLNAKGRLEVQHLLVPSVVAVSPADAARIDEERALFESLGWVVEGFGEGAVAVRAVPAVLRRPDPEAMLREVLALLDAGRRDGIDRAALVSSVVDRMACRGAVMAGDALDPAEVVALLEQAEALNHAHSCPHGRPTRLVLRRRELERHFHRIQ